MQYGSSSVQLKVNIVVQIILAVYSINSHYNYEYVARTIYLQKNKLSIQKEQTQQILKILLPDFICDKIEKGEEQIQEDQGEVSVIFCEILNFDKIIHSKQRSLIPFLDQVFRNLDRLCQDHNISKIEV